MNTVTLRGTIRNIQPSHIINNVEYEKAELVVPSVIPDKEDNVIALRFKKFSNLYKENQEIEITGNIRSYSQQLSDGKNKVQIYVFTYFDYPEESEVNKVCLDGRICKMNDLRQTTDGRDILHFILANNIISSSGAKKINSYIPCTCFGSLAKQLSECKVNDVIEIEGQLCSRSYKKVLDNGELEIRIAHEVVITSANILA